MNQTPAALYPVLEQRLSPARLATYLTAAGGDQARAVALYEWNLVASSALYRALAVVEIAVRNAIHEQLSRWHAKEGRRDTWLHDPAKLLEERARTDIRQARKRAQRGGRGSANVGSIVAELSFGFWNFLLAARYEHTLWTPAIRFGFPHAGGARQRVAEPVSRLYQARNRIAHLEPVITRDLLADDDDISRVLRTICASTARWASSLRDLRAVARARP